MKISCWCTACEAFREVEGAPARCLTCGERGQVLTGDLDGPVQYEPVDFAVPPSKHETTKES